MTVGAVTVDVIEQHIEDWLPELAEPVELPEPAWTRAPVQEKPAKKVTPKERKKRRRR